MTNIGEKAISILAGDTNSGLSCLITTVKEIEFGTQNLSSDILLVSLVTYNIVNTFNRYGFHLSAHSLFIVCQMGSFLKSKSISWGVSFVHKDWKCSASQQWRARVCKILISGWAF